MGFYHKFVSTGSFRGNVGRPSAADSVGGNGTRTRASAWGRRDGLFGVPATDLAYFADNMEVGTLVIMNDDVSTKTVASRLIQSLNEECLLYVDLTHTNLTRSFDLAVVGELDATSIASTCGRRMQL